MPSLDDIPTLPLASPSLDDQLAVIDGADRRSPRRTTLSAVKTLTLSGNLGAIQASSLSVGDLSFSGSVPTTDPMIAGAVWADPAADYALKVSLGS